MLNNNKVMRTIDVILIDPTTKIIAKVETNGTFLHFQQIIQHQYLESFRGSGDNLIIFGDSSILTKPGFYIGGQIIRGRAIVVGASVNGYVESHTDIEEFRTLIIFE